MFGYGTMGPPMVVNLYCIEGGEWVGTLALSENKLRGTFSWDLSLHPNLKS